MIYIIIPLIAGILAQAAKYAIRLYYGASFSAKSISWSFIWASGPPSIHLVYLSSILCLIYLKQGAGPLFGFGVVMALVVSQGFIEDKKRQLLYDKYFRSAEDPKVRAIADKGQLLDISGHTAWDLLFGSAFGILATLLLVQFIRL